MSSKGNEVNKERDLSITGIVNLQLIDTRTGEIVRTINKKNTDTIIAKLSMPVSSLYMDIITKPLDEIFGIPFDKYSKSVAYERDAIRSGLVSVQFSYDSDNKRYTAQFSYENTGVDSVKIYGLVSWDSNSNVITILDLTDEDIVVDQYYNLIGKYIITFNESTPDVTNNSFSQQSVSEMNTVIYNTNVTPDIRNYKLTRQFVQKTLHYGVDTSEIPESVIISSVIADSDDKKVLGNDSQFYGELIYEITQDGAPGTAKAKKYFALPYVKSVPGDFTYENVKFDVSVQSTGFSTNSVTFNPDGKPVVIYPSKIVFPKYDDTLDYSVYNKYSLTLSKECYNSSLYYKLYWNPDTTSQIYVWTNFNTNCITSLTLPDGTTISGTPVTSSSNCMLAVLNIPDNNPGEGILKVSGNGSLIVISIFGNDVWCYGSWLPGKPTEFTDIQVPIGSNTLGTLDQLDSNYWCFVTTTKEDFETNKNFGVFEKSYTINTSNTYLVPGVPYNIGNDNDSYIQYNAYSGSTFTGFIPKELLKVDDTNTLNLTLEKLCLPTAQVDAPPSPIKVALRHNFDTNKLEPIIKDNIPEEIINESEVVANLTINFTSDSVFKAGENWKVSINDSDDALLVDALEVWNNVSITQYTFENEFWNEYDGTSSLSTVKSSSSNTPYVFTPKVIDIKKPNFNILDASGKYNPNKVAIYEIAYESDRTNIPVLLLPKVLKDDNGNELIVNIDSIIVTNGQHIIPHEASLVPDNLKTDNDVEYQDDYWKIKLNHKVLNEVYGDGSGVDRIQLYVFFEAKKKEELLPYEISGIIYGGSNTDDINESFVIVHLPFVVDGYVDIVDDEGNSYDFEILRTSLKRLESDTDKGNLLFVKVPCDKSDIDIIPKGGSYKFTYSIRLPSYYYLSSWEYSSIFVVFSNICKFTCNGWINSCGVYADSTVITYSEKVSKSIFKTEYTKYKYKQKFKLKLVVSSSNNNKELLTTENYFIAYSSTTKVSKYFSQVSISSYSQPDNTTFYSYVDGNFWSDSSKIEYEYTGTYEGSAIDYNYFFNSTISKSQLEKIYSDYKSSWTNEYIYSYLISPFLVQRVTNLIFKPKIDKSTSSTDLSYMTMYYIPLLIDDVANNYYLLLRSKYSVSRNPVFRTISNLQPGKILTKHYTQDNFEVIGKSTIDKDYPVSNDTESYTLYFFKESCLSVQNRWIFKSDKLQQILSNGNFSPSETIKCITEDTFNNLSGIQTSASTIDVSGAITQYFVVSSNSCGAYTAFTENEIIKSKDYYCMSRNHRTNGGNLAQKTISLNYSDGFVFIPSIDDETDVTWIKLNDNQVEIWRNATPGINSLLLSTEEIKVDNVNSFGKFTIEYWSNEYWNVANDTTKHFKFYPVILIKDTSTGEEKLFGIDVQGRPIDITKHYEVFKSGESVSEKWLQYLLYNKFTYEYFNKLLDVYKDGNGTYTFKYGFIWHVPSTAPNHSYIFKGMTLSPEFTDDTLYDEIPWCYVNKHTDELFANDISEISCNANIIKIYNPNSYSVTLPVKVSLKKAGIDTTQFTDGVIVKDSSGNTLKSCYVSKYGKGKPTDVFENWNQDEIYVRVSLPAKQITEVTVENGIIANAVYEVFDFVDNFETFDTTKWIFAYTPVKYRTLTWNSNIDLGDVDTNSDGTTDAHRYGSEVGIVVKGVEPIELTDNQTLIIRGDATSSNIYGIYTNETISNVTDKQIHIRYKLLSNNTDIDYQFGFNHTLFNSLPTQNTNADSIIRSNTSQVCRYKGTSSIDTYVWLNISKEFVEENFSWTGKIRLDVSPQVDLYHLEYIPNKKLVFQPTSETPINTNAPFGIFVKTTSTNGVEIDWIYMTEKYDKEPIVLYKDDVCVAIPESNATWYIIDTISTPSPDKDTTQSILDSYKEKVYVTERLGSDEYPYYTVEFNDAYYDNYHLLRSNFGYTTYRKL